MVCLCTCSTWQANQVTDDLLHDFRVFDLPAGKLVKACYGTTKYCNAFLKGLPCNNADCLYLHDVGEHTAWSAFVLSEMQPQRRWSRHNPDYALLQLRRKTATQRRRPSQPSL